MKFTKDERLKIGRLIYIRQLTIADACNKFDLNRYTARDYMREYRDKNSLPPMTLGTAYLTQPSNDAIPKYAELVSLSQDKLIDEIIRSYVNTERAKKGYAVKGGGREKEFISLSDLNTK